MQITRSSLGTVKGPADWFTGDVYIDTVAANPEPSRVNAANVHFTPGARTAWHRHLLGLFQRYDILALPTAQVFPFDVNQHWPREVAGRAMDTYHRWMEVVIGPTLAGLPAISVPVGFDARGLPMGMQLIGRPRADLDVLQLAHAYDRATGWAAKSPPPAA